MLLVAIYAASQYTQAATSPDHHDTPIPHTAQVEIIAQGLHHPWGLAPLPNGDILVTERSGALRRVSMDGTVSDPLAGVPDVYAEGQGGLLDVVLDPNFAKTRTLYLSYAEAQGDTSGTAVARAVLTETGLEDVRVIFRQHPKVKGSNHFGSRLVFAHDGNLFVTLGERFDHMDQAQTLDNHLGKVIRITPTGAPAPQNPFVDQPTALPEIWSYGHRNPQGAARHPQTGQIWIHEHGPRGGDEINIPKPGANYGWPKASYGRHYSLMPIKDDHAGQGFAEPLYQWTPPIAPSGMAFYTGQAFPQWQGNLFIGALAGQHLVRLVLDGNTVVEEHRLLAGKGWRIRAISQGQDGALYLLTDDDNGQLVKLVPAS